eukprot:TRINITY_DN37156_c0_g1_i1.p1 TRINITY_DN37156_c0_g1~~TRINITY_DN37156_c0_g1_i1.p1  ORF type:complete len:695 (+),score=103.89 TRINITY_DN37156_c0_g1_i1:225-2309(+)
MSGKGFADLTRDAGAAAARMTELTDRLQSLHREVVVKNTFLEVGEQLSSLERSDGWRRQKSEPVKVYLNGRDTEGLNSVEPLEQTPHGGGMTISDSSFDSASSISGGLPESFYDDQREAVPTRTEVLSLSDSIPFREETDITKIKPPWTDVTTVMMRNLPNKYTQQMLLEELQRMGFTMQQTFDFFYLPMDHVNAANLGYAFINLVDTPTANAFAAAFSGQKMQRFNSNKTVLIMPASIQGFERNQAYYASTRVAHADDPQYRPLFLRQQPVPTVINQQVVRAVVSPPSGGAGKGKGNGFGGNNGGFPEDLQMGASAGRDVNGVLSRNVEKASNRPSGGSCCDGSNIGGGCDGGLGSGLCGSGADGFAYMDGGGNRVTGGSGFGGGCGNRMSQIPRGNMACTSCGNPVSHDHRFCARCGSFIQHNWCEEPTFHTNAVPRLTNHSSTRSGIGGFGDYGGCSGNEGCGNRVCGGGCGGYGGGCEPNSFPCCGSRGSLLKSAQEANPYPTEQQRLYRSFGNQGVAFPSSGCGAGGGGLSAAGVGPCGPGGGSIGVNSNRGGSFGCSGEDLLQNEMLGSVLRRYKEGHFESPNIPSDCGSVSSSMGGIKAPYGGGAVDGLMRPSVPVNVSNSFGEKVTNEVDVIRGRQLLLTALKEREMRDRQPANDCRDSMPYQNMGHFRGMGDGPLGERYWASMPQ